MLLRPSEPPQLLDPTPSRQASKRNQRADLSGASRVCSTEQGGR